MILFTFVRYLVLKKVIGTGRDQVPVLNRVQQCLQAYTLCANVSVHVSWVAFI